MSGESVGGGGVPSEHQPFQCWAVDGGEVGGAERWPQE